MWHVGDNYQLDSEEATVEAASSKPRELDHSTERLTTWRPSDCIDKQTFSSLEIVLTLYMVVRSMELSRARERLVKSRLYRTELIYWLSVFV
jgi:hypothetical protein